MNKIKGKNRKKIINWILAALGMLSIMCILCTVLGIPWNTWSERGVLHDGCETLHPETSFWIAYVGIILSSLSIGFITINLFLQLWQLSAQRKELIRVSKSNDENFTMAALNYDSYVLNLLEEFLSNHMKDCRQLCWLLREEIKKNPDVLVELKELFKKQIKDSWGTREEYAELQKTSRFNDYSCCLQLIRFFEMMQYYRISEHTAKAIHFYYAWWRSFFILIIDCFKEAFNEIPDSEKHLCFLPDWCSMIENYDDKMKEYKLPL